MILDGRAVAKEIEEDIAATLATLTGRQPCLAVILVGHDPASHVYVSRKTRACQQVGIASIRKDLPTTISETELQAEIELLNANPEVDGILVQMPLPSHIDPIKVTTTLDPAKDVDGFHPLNVGKLFSGNKEAFVPCTPLGIHYLLQRYDIPVAGRHVVIVGRSQIVGRPMAALLMQNAPGCNATVTVAHRFTQDLPTICRSADILITAIGQPRIIHADMVKEGVVVVDVGINKMEDPASDKGYRLVGDVDFDAIKPKCSYITPVPGGVGPLTIAMLLKNTLLSYQQREHL